MKVKYAIVLPITKPELAKSCIDSIDKNIRKHIIKVDNTTDNIGVSRSWNIGVQHVLDNDLDFLIICSQSMVFADGMRDLISLLKRGQSGINTNFGWHLIALSNDTLTKCGMFDTNFYPAYYEDSDYIRRLELLGIHQPQGEIQLPYIEVAGSVQGQALAANGENAIKINYGAMGRYFEQKWGGDPTYTPEHRQTLYKTPFNNPSFPLDYFEDKTIEQLKIEYNL